MPIDMRTFPLFVRFFGYGWLCLQLVLAPMRVLSGRMPSDDMAPQFAPLFVTVLWIPVGGVLAVVATAVNRQVQAGGWIVLLVALLAGMLFLGGFLVATRLEIQALLFLPFALYLMTTASLRGWQRLFGRGRPSRAVP